MAVEADAVAAAVPEQLRGHVVLAQDAVVGDGLIEREERVHGPLHEQHRRRDAANERVARSAREEPVARLGVQRAGLRALVEGGADVRVELLLRRGGVEQAGPAELDDGIFVEARGERVPGNLRRDGVDPLVDRGRDELDAAPVRAAGHADARVAERVELGLRLLRQPVEQGLHITALEVRAVHLHGAARGAEAARVPGQDVVAGGVEAADRLAGRLVDVAGAAPAVAEEDRRRGLAAALREPVDGDRGAVERRHRQVGRAGRGREHEKGRERDRKRAEKGPYGGAPR
jgi:hypothetical protein